MKEPKRIPLTENPRNKEPEKIPLPPTSKYDTEIVDDIWIKNENNNQNNTTSIQKLESDQTN